MKALMHHPCASKRYQAALPDMPVRPSASVAALRAASLHHLTVSSNRAAAGRALRNSHHEDQTLTLSLYSASLRVSLRSALGGVENDSLEGLVVQRRSTLRRYGR